MNCTHPNHKDGESCIERAVACNPLCICCLGETQVEINMSKKIHVLFACSDEPEFDIHAVSRKLKGKPVVIRKATLDDMKTIKWEDDFNPTEEDLKEMMSDYIVFEEV